MTPLAETARILSEDREKLLARWIEDQLGSVDLRPDLLSEADLRQQSHDFLSDFFEAIERSGAEDARADAWDGARRRLANLSRTRGLLGFSSSETATFIFSLKRTAFSLLSERLAGSPEKLLAATIAVSGILDQLGLFTIDEYQAGREEIINRQQREVLELSTPVVELWKGILALPIIGTLDSARTQLVMDNLLERILITGAPIAVIDITGVPTVDTAVAQHLLKTVAATRLMGADCVISGIRPQIAQTLVHLGVDLREVQTTASLADALALAFARVNLRVSPDNGTARS